MVLGRILLSRATFDQTRKAAQVQMVLNLFIPFRDAEAACRAEVWVSHKPMGILLRTRCHYNACCSREQ